MRKTVIAAALMALSAPAVADGYVTTYMTTECGLRGFMAFKLVQAYQLGKQVVDETPEKDKEMIESVVGLDLIPQETAQWVTAVATSKLTVDNTLYPAFASWYQHVGSKGIQQWAATIVETHDNPVQASIDERLACEKHYANEPLDSKMYQQFFGKSQTDRQGRE